MTDHIHKPGDPRIFVFGSNLMGIHGAGAAAYARSHCAATLGVGEGLTGRAYALPTCHAPTGTPMSLLEVSNAVQRFLSYARAWPELRFFVSEVGCGIARFKAEEIAPLFKDAPANCDLPPGWKALLAEESKRIGRMYGADRDYSGDPPTGR